MNRTASILKRGTIAGLLGAATVAAWFFALDVAAGSPFRTPAVLGHALRFGGAGASQTGDSSVRVVASYMLVQLVAFVLAGWVFAFIAEQLERRPSFVLLAVMTLIVLEAVAVVNLAEGAQRSGLAIWPIIVANVLSVAVMTWYMWRTHPNLWHKLTTVPPTRARV